MDQDTSSNGLQLRRRLEFENDDAFDMEQDDSIFVGIEDYEENDTSITSHVPFELVPSLGMEFDTEESAYKFYNAYANKMGFGARTSAGHKDKKSNRILDRIFCCSREGKRSIDKRNANVKSHHRETRCKQDVIVLQR
ncbi:hypothetical protein ACH5RR_029422 [Cinchona calisaya]|uniref:FAR1 domain-containing protein n=1 Tax=Cinchona calisaya TaxID=153742 RepID=A0ABD2YRL6_9GENT